MCGFFACVFFVAMECNIFGYFSISWTLFYDIIFTNCFSMYCTTEQNITSGSHGCYLSRTWRSLFTNFSKPILAHVNIHVQYYTKQNMYERNKMHVTYWIQLYDWLVNINAERVSMCGKTMRVYQCIVYDLYMFCYSKSILNLFFVHNDTYISGNYFIIIISLSTRVVIWFFYCLWFHLAFRVFDKKRPQILMSACFNIIDIVLFALQLLLSQRLNIRKRALTHYTTLCACVYFNGLVVFVFI